MEWTNEMTMMMVDGVRETLFMTLLSTIFGYLLGLPMVQAIGQGGRRWLVDDLHNV